MPILAAGLKALFNFQDFLSVVYRVQLGNVENLSPFPQEYFFWFTIITIFCLSATCNLISTAALTDTRNKSTFLETLLNVKIWQL